jgi:hypothetical protein
VCLLVVPCMGYLLWRQLVRAAVNRQPLRTAT